MMHNFSYIKKRTEHKQVKQAKREFLSKLLSACKWILNPRSDPEHADAQSKPKDSLIKAKIRLLTRWPVQTAYELTYSEISRITTVVVVVAAAAIITQ